MDMIKIRFLQHNSVILPILLACSVFYLVTFPISAYADSHFSLHRPYDVNFSLSFSKDDIKLYGNNRSYIVDQRQISAHFSNPVTSNIYTGLIIGASYINMDDDPLTSDINLNGNHAAFTVTGNAGINPQLAFRGQILYQEVRGSNTIRSASLAWFEWLTVASMRVNLGPFLRLGIEGGFIGIDAKRRINGDVSDKLNLKQDGNLQGQLALDLNTDPNGRISIIIHRGVKSGTDLVFTHEF